MRINTHELYFAAVTFYPEMKWTREDLKEAKKILANWDDKWNDSDRKILKDRIEFYEKRYRNET